jgi:biotin carboxylase
MILGAGIMQMPALEIASRNGWKTLCVDGDAGAPGSSLADEFRQVDLKDKEALLSLAEKTRNEQGLDGVFTVGTDFSASVAWVAENLDLPGISFETALNATDKVRMRSCFRLAGVSSPLFFDVSGDIPDEALKMKFPVVVKPVDNMGARGVIKILEASELPEAVRFALPFSRSGRVIVEEFIPGTEYSLDAVVSKGQIQITGFADRHIFFPPYFVELGHTMPSMAPRRIRQAVEKVFRDGIKALGITDGAAKGDIKWDGRRAVAGEIAARLSGGYMSGWTYPLASGFSSIEAAMRISLGMDPGTAPGWCLDHSAERAFLSIPGTVATIDLPESRPEHLYLRIKPGDRVRFPRNNVEKCGNIITHGPDRRAVVDRAERYAAGILVRLDPDDADTAVFLNNPEEWIPLPFAGMSVRAGRFKSGIFRGGPVDFRVLPRLNGSRVIPVWKDWQKESAPDWNGRRLGDSVRLLLDISGRDPVFLKNPQDDPWFRWLWKAFFTGGVQGALWFIDRSLHQDPLS